MKLVKILMIDIYELKYLWIRALTKKNATLLVILSTAVIYLKKYKSGFKEVNVKSLHANTQRKY